MIGSTAINSLRMTLDQIGLLRLVTSDAFGAYVNHGVWVITSITPASAQSVLVSMLDVTQACSPMSRAGKIPSPSGGSSLWCLSGTVVSCYIVPILSN